MLCLSLQNEENIPAPKIIRVFLVLVVVVVYLF